MSPPLLFSVDALIFDLDGVLVDSNQIAERHWQRWAERRGVSFDLIARSHHGRPTVQTMREVAPHLDAVAEAEMKESVEADDTVGLVAFPGAHRILAVLPSDRWAIVTSGTRRTATTRLNHTLLPIPQRFVTADDVQNGKPDPEPYRKAIEQLGFRPDRCLVLEDAPAGIQSARAAGAQVVAISSTNSPDALTHANVIVDCLDLIEVKPGAGEIQIRIRNSVVPQIR
ncbi:HAD-IA family hydrolase [Planctomicrobium sp. SH661]|uniref:HAD-IA family hydrolase n=1 Tax=Planctomicrobium sp. SH661 TaxID=3448124 RepID=UPI003F5B5148